MSAKAALWLGHYSMLALWPFIVTLIAWDALGGPPALTLAMTVTWALSAAANRCDARCHTERLCERCIAATPLDPQAAVTRSRAILRAYHSIGTALALGVAGVACAVPLLLGLGLRHPPLWAYALDVLAVLALGTVEVITWQHRRLYPWCPFCRWDDGGDHEVSPDVPAPAATR